MIPILLYHSVTEWPASRMRRWTVSPRTFDRHARLIAESGRTCLTVGELVARRHADDRPRRPVVLTFDDGFADNLDATRRLADYGLTATVYVTTSWLGEPGMLTDTTVQSLAELGVELGGHSHTHRRFDELPSADRRRELSACRSSLAAVLGRDITSFAYPHGTYDRRTRDLVAEAGFKSACAVRNALSRYDDDPFALARLTVQDTTSDETVSAWLAEEGPQVPDHELLRTKGWRTFRRVRNGLARRPTREWQPENLQPGNPQVGSLQKGHVASDHREERAS